MKRVLLACKESQIVTIEMRKLGLEAFSCDLVECSGGHPEWHIKGNVFKILDEKWDMMIAFPPCTFLTNAGAGWFYHPEDKHLPTKDRRPHPRFPHRRAHQRAAVVFFIQLANAPIEKIAIENPVGIISTVWKKPDQYVHPYYFGDHQSKKTGLWLKNLPKLKSTKIVKPRIHVSNNGKRSPMWHRETLDLPHEERSRIRSKTFEGFAKAIAMQWGKLLMLSHKRKIY